jgi:hypothetical protein
MRTSRPCWLPLHPDVALHAAAEATDGTVAWRAVIGWVRAPFDHVTVEPDSRGNPDTVTVSGPNGLTLTVGHEPYLEPDTHQESLDLEEDDDGPDGWTAIRLQAAGCEWRWPVPHRALGPVVQTAATRQPHRHTHATVADVTLDDDDTPHRITLAINEQAARAIAPLLRHRVVDVDAWPLSGADVALDFGDIRLAVPRGDTFTLIGLTSSDPVRMTIRGDTPDPTRINLDVELSPLQLVAAARATIRHDPLHLNLADAFPAGALLHGIH